MMRFTWSLYLKKSGSMCLPVSLNGKRGVWSIWQHRSKAWADGRGQVRNDFASLRENRRAKYLVHVSAEHVFHVGIGDLPTVASRVATSLSFGGAGAAGGDVISAAPHAGNVNVYLMLLPLQVANHTRKEKDNA